METFSGIGKMLSMSDTSRLIQRQELAIFCILARRAFAGMQRQQNVGEIKNFSVRPD